MFNSVEDHHTTTGDTALSTYKEITNCLNLQQEKSLVENLEIYQNQNLLFSSSASFLTFWHELSSDSRHFCIITQTQHTLNWCFTSLNKPALLPSFSSWLAWSRSSLFCFHRPPSYRNRRSVLFPYWPSSVVDI